MLELALVRWALEKLRGHGFEPVIPPVLVRERALYGTGFLPDTEQQIYRLPEDELLPRRAPPRWRWPRCTTGRSSTPSGCRCATPASRPASAARPARPGKDTRGIFRVHQFDKVEMFSFVSPEESRRRARADPRRSRRRSSRELGLPYRVVNIAVTDLGSSAAKKYDCEAWLPSQGRYRELTSCSNTTDYQARRLNIRMRRARGATDAGTADAAHAQRHRRRGRAHDRRAARERPARGRQRRAAAGAPRLRRAGAAAAGGAVAADEPPTALPSRSCRAVRQPIWNTIDRAFPCACVSVSR